jgi:hypothetical protein
MISAPPTVQRVVAGFGGAWVGEGALVPAVVVPAVVVVEPAPPASAEAGALAVAVAAEPCGWAEGSSRVQCMARPSPAQLYSAS